MTAPTGTTVHIQRILFATDFSSTAALAFPYAAAFARRFGAELCVAHVMEPGAYATAAVTHQAAARTGQLLAASNFSGVRHETVVVEGDILPTLASLVQQRQADLMVLGMHGWHGVAKLLLGSVAEEIMRLAEVPVLFVGPEVRVPAEQELSMQRVLYAADFSPGCGRALHYASAIADAEEAHLLVLHVVEDVWNEALSTRMSAEGFLRHKLLEKGWMAALERLKPQLMIDFGPVEERILQKAEEQRVDLIVLDVPPTAHPLVTAHLPGPLAYNVASHARCPVLTVRGTSLAD